MNTIAILSTWSFLGGLIAFYYRPKVKRLIKEKNEFQYQLAEEQTRHINNQTRSRDEIIRLSHDVRFWKTRSEEAESSISVRNRTEDILRREMAGLSQRIDNLISENSTLISERNALRDQLMNNSNPNIDPHFTEIPTQNQVSETESNTRNNIELRSRNIGRRSEQIRAIEEARRIRLGSISSIPDIPPFQWTNHEMLETQRRLNEESQRNILRAAFRLRSEIEFPDFISEGNQDHIINIFGRMTDFLMQPNGEIQPVIQDSELPTMQERRIRFQRALLNLRNLISPGVYDTLPWEEIIENLGFHGLWDHNIDGPALSAEEMNNLYFHNIQQQSQEVQENQEIDYLTPEEKEMTDQIAELNAVIVDKTNFIISLKNLIKEFHSRVVYQETETDKRKYRLPAFIAFIAEDLLNRE